MTYNAANQITSVETDAAGASVATDHSYVYDDMHRLISAQGTIDDEQKDYFFSRSYDDRFNIASAQLTTSVNSEVIPEDSYAGNYTYDGIGANAPSSIRGVDQEYDGNGNLVSAYGQGVYTYKQYLWDEENRLRAVSDNGRITRYTYDAFGRRVNQKHGWLPGRILSMAALLDLHSTPTITGSM